MRPYEKQREEEMTENVYALAEKFQIASSAFAAAVRHKPSRAQKLLLAMTYCLVVPSTLAFVFFPLYNPYSQFSINASTGTSNA